MNTPGSSYWVAPRTRNSIDSKVLPHPGPPQTRVGLPRGKPPPVISSSPWMPVGAFAKTSGETRRWLSGFFMAAFLARRKAGASGGRDEPDVIGSEQGGEGRRRRSDA